MRSRATTADSTREESLSRSQTTGQDRFREKERSILTGFILGLVALAPDAVAVILANSVMLLSDLLKSASETVATFLSWLAVRKVRRGESFDYNYGQGKLENISSLAVAGAMMLSWMIVTYGAIERFRHPEPIGSIGLALFVTGGSALVNLWVWRKNLRLTRIEPSPILESQWRLYRAKFAANISVVISLLVSAGFRGQRWAAYVDPAGAIIISLFLLLSAYRVITDSIYDLLDRTLDESLQLVILSELAAYYHEYAALHGIRSRRSGSNVYIEIFMEFDGERRMSEVQELIDRIKTSLEEKIQGSRVLIAPTSMNGTHASSVRAGN
ncbi:MAG: cation diffusion facilitator family transporter [Acidobacteriota bacterium]|nr:MAG: cation diffusion facilitator family transporter [Acidobacteriota bacterium]